MMSSEQIRLTEKEAQMLASFIGIAQGIGTIRICCTDDIIEVHNENGLKFLIHRKDAAWLTFWPE